MVAEDSLLLVRVFDSGGEATLVARIRSINAEGKIMRELEHKDREVDPKRYHGDDYILVEGKGVSVVDDAIVQATLLSPADRLNGIQWKGWAKPRTVVYAGVYHKRPGHKMQWGEWKDIEKESEQHPGSPELLRPDARGKELMKKDGQWFVNLWEQWRSMDDRLSRHGPTCEMVLSDPQAR